MDFETHIRSNKHNLSTKLFNFFSAFNKEGENKEVKQMRRMSIDILMGQMKAIASSALSLTLSLY